MESLTRTAHMLKDRLVVVRWTQQEQRNSVD